MSGNKKSKRKNKRAMDKIAWNMARYGRHNAELDQSGQKRRGPPTHRALRKHGDPEKASVLALALGEAGKTDRATHGFHAYPAGMHPACAQRIIEMCPGPVHDPFCGGGTVLVEGRLAGREISGSDLSPIAKLISTARCSGPEMATPLRSASRKLAQTAQLRTDVEVPEVCIEWYEPHVAQELGRLRDGIKTYPETIQPLLNAVFSSILVKSSFRESDTSNKRRPYQRPPGTTAILFHKKARELGRMLEKMPPQQEMSIRLGDARELTPPKDRGLILTSPPYPGVYDYLPMQQLRAAWLEQNIKGKAALEVGSRRQFRSKGRKEALTDWQVDTQAWIEKQANSLAIGGALIIVVGDGLVGDKLVDALFPTVEAMTASGLTIAARASADRPDHARSSIRTEHLVMGIK